MSDDLSQLSFEQAVEQLDALIARLEGGQIDLADAVAAYQRGTELAAHCAALLDRTEATITQLVSGPAGGAEIPLDVASKNTGAPLPRARPAAGRGDPGLFPGVTPVPSTASNDVDPDDIPF